MTDGQTLFAVFAAFYFVECLRLVHAHAWVAAGDKGWRWRLRRGEGRLVISGGSPQFLSLLPPLRAHVQTLPWLFLPDEQGLRVANTDGKEVLLPWEALKPSCEGGLLKPGGALALRMPSAESAAHWEQVLKDWRDLPPEKRRAAFLKQARASLNTEHARRVAEQAADRTKWLRMLGELVFMWTFGVFPVTYYLHGENRVTLITLAVLPLLTLIQGWLFLRVVKRHRLPVKKRWLKAFAFATLPHHAIRAADLISLTHEHLPHPLALRGLLSDEDYLTLAREMWREARYRPGWSRSESLSPEAEALQRHFRDEKLTEADFDPEPQLAPEAAAWCPCCHAPFLKTEVPCSDCGGVELRLVKKTEGGSAA